MPHSIPLDVNCKTCKGQKESSVAIAGSQGGSLAVERLMRSVWTSRANK